MKSKRNLFLNSGISDDVICHILSFQCPSSLYSLEVTCKSFRSEDGEYHRFINDAWDHLCEKRWNIRQKEEKLRVQKILAVKVAR